MITLEELSECVYEDLNGRIVTVDVKLETYHVFFECDDWSDHSRRRRFELVFRDVPEATATPSSAEGLVAVAEHPVLWQHNDGLISRFFSSAPREPMDLIGRLYEAHERLCCGWRRLSDCLHADSALLA